MKHLQRNQIALAVAQGLLLPNRNICYADMPSSFNVEAFASGQFEGQNDTRYLRLDAKEYNAVIEGPFGEKGKTTLDHNQEKGFVVLNVMWRPNDEEQQAKLGIKQMPLLRQSIFLDVTPTGALDMGPFKNGALGRLRDAIGLNQEGVRWSFQDFVGRPARIKLEHKPNEKDPMNPFQNVTSVTRI